MRKIRPLDALFPRTRQDVLATLYVEPAREWYLSDLARHLKVQPSSLQRELARLNAAGIIRKRRDGNRVYFSAETEGPIFTDLQGLLLKTAGMKDVLAEALAPFRGSIAVAFVSGSLARGEEVPRSDIDLMVIGRVGLAELAPALSKAEEKLLRPVNPSVYTPSEIAEKLASGHHFLRTVMSQEKLFIVGSEDELAAITRHESGPRSRGQQTSAR
jgi:DNA-binding transcriptional ArsR family regulator